MSTFWAVLHVELRLAWRRRSFWIVQALVLIIALPSFWGYKSTWEGPTGLMTMAQEVQIMLLLELLLLPLAIGPAITRDRGGAGDTLWTTPLDAFAHLLGVVAGLCLALLPFLVVQIAARWLLGLAVGVNRPEIIWIYGLPLLVLGTCAGVAIASVLGVLLGRTVLLVVIWVALWAANMYFFNGITIGGRDAWRFFFKLPDLDFFLSPVAGLGLSRSLLVGRSIWFLGMGLTMLALATLVALLVDRRRSLRYGVPLLVWALVAGTVQVSGYVAHARAAAAQAPPFSPHDVQMNAWTVRQHSMEVNVDAKRSTIEGSSTLVLQAAQPRTTNQLVLRFNPGMTLDTVTADGEQSLTATRQGDSMIIALPASPTVPLTLHTTWHGTPRPAYIDYGYGYKYPTAPIEPQPVRAVLVDGVGYLLRDGDWYPWPWSTQAYHTRQSSVTLHTASPRALTSPPLQNGTITWNDALPPALLVLPPNHTQIVSGSTLYGGPLGGQQLVNTLQRLPPALQTLTRVLGNQAPPRQLIALPYLNDLVWSGDQLLVPDGSGFTSTWSYDLDPEATAETKQRALVAQVAEAWIASHMAATRPMLWIGQTGTFDPNTPRGRWIEQPEYASSGMVSLSNTYVDSETGERGIPDAFVEPQQQIEALAAWLAIELAEPAVHTADLDAINTFRAQASEPQPAQATNTSMTYIDPLFHRLLPLSSEDHAVILALHDWATQIGTEHALSIFGETLQTSEVSNLEQLMHQLEQRSGVPLVDHWRVLQPEP
jgi:hypothetical protein